MLEPLTDKDIKMFYNELVVKPCLKEQRAIDLKLRKQTGWTSPFVCRECFPPRRNTPTKALMYGGYKGADIHSQRACSVCDTRPIWRFVIWREDEFDVVGSKVQTIQRTKGFCRNHLSEAWIEQSKHPEDFGWDDPSR